MFCLSPSSMSIPMSSREVNVPSCFQTFSWSQRAQLVLLNYRVVGYFCGVVFSQFNLKSCFLSFMQRCSQTFQNERMAMKNHRLTRIQSVGSSLHRPCTKCHFIFILCFGLKGRSQASTEGSSSCLLHSYLYGKPQSLKFQNSVQSMQCYQIFNCALGFCYIVFFLFCFCFFCFCFVFVCFFAWLNRSVT